MFNRLTSWALKRLREKSTWMGLTVVTSALGIAVSPELVEAIAVAGVGAVGLLQIVWPEVFVTPEPPAVIEEDNSVG